MVLIILGDSRLAYGLKKIKLLTLIQVYLEDSVYFPKFNSN